MITEMQTLAGLRRWLTNNNVQGVDAKDEEYYFIVGRKHGNEVRALVPKILFADLFIRNEIVWAHDKPNDLAHNQLFGLRT